MPAINQAYIDSLIDEFIGAYAVTAFHNMNLNRILHMMNANGGSGGGGGLASTPLPITSANFINATDCPIAEFNGLNLAIYWNDTNRFLTPVTDWSVLVGGGFKILIPGFDSTTATFTFYVFTTP